MTSRSINRQEFLVLTITVGAAAVLGCSDDPAAPPTPGASGSGGTPPSTGGGGSGGVATGGGGAATGGGGASTGGGGASTGGGGAGTAGRGGSGGSGGGAGAGGSNGGSGGGGGASGSGGGGAGGMCGTAKIEHPAMGGHTHIPDPGAMLDTFLMTLKTLINSTPAGMESAEFRVAMDGQNDHTHTFKLSAAQIMTLKGGGMVTGVMSTTDEGHPHTYTISCMS